jgi:hypothetical protein
MPLKAEAIEQRLLHHSPLAHYRPNLLRPGEGNQRTAPRSRAFSTSGNGRELFCEGRYDRPGYGRGDRSMDYFAGLDISMDETHVCVINREGEVVRESKTASIAQAIADEF